MYAVMDITAIDTITDITLISIRRTTGRRIARPAEVESGRVEREPAASCLSTFDLGLSTSLGGNDDFPDHRRLGVHRLEFSVSLCCAGCGSGCSVRSEHWIDREPQ